MIRIWSSHSSAFCICNPAKNVADHRLQLLACRNELEGCGEVDFGHTLRKTKCVNFFPRIKRSSSLWIFRTTQGRRQCGDSKQGGKLQQTVATILEGDVVEYVQPSDDTEIGEARKRKRLGAVVSVTANASSAFCEIEPLRQEELGSNQWVQDEDQPQVCVPLSQVQIIEAWPSQRMDNDRVANPHGEHAHNVWLIDPASLSVDD